ncbi:MULTISPECIES: RagB/SusD family nutrient uptake outer membrane protein [Pedobacter]|uniref:RagB/SusD family nutrient uptake outer membrane protein n=1 Tax=Pedobacter TaxID=84567 RepID=UPI00210E1E91|nr:MULTISPECIES: RagB/SusD family nutrient uptake outer membrane protein [unclassified Pedobacter]
MKAFSVINKISTVAIILTGLVASSCKKLIEIPSNATNKVSAEFVFTDSASIVSAVAGVYTNFGLSAFSPLFGSGAVTIYTGLTGDELTVGASTYTGTDFYNNQITPDNSTNRSIWADAYKNLYQINICLNGIEGSNAISSKLKNQLIGELKVDRALYYYYMVNLWGPVPLITSTDYKETQRMPRSSVEDVFKLIMSDLTDAQQRLTAEYPSAGRIRPNLHVAQALLAKVYLYLGQYQNAIDASSKVISSPLYSLTALNNVFLSGSEEAIWQLPANGVYYQTVEASTFIPYSPTAQPNYVLSPQLLAAFESGDPRVAIWTGVNTVGSATYYYPRKYKNTSAGQTPAEDYMIFRLADIYLVRAEAYAQLDKLPEALADLNKIRDRAQDRVDISTDSKATALSAILHERQVELFCEWGNRWIDLKRTKMIDAVLDPVKPFWKSSAAVFPVPLAERQANPALDQNDDY